MKKLLKYTALAAAVILLILLCVRLIPFVMSLADPEGREKFRGFIESLGAPGILVMLLLQTTQIIAAIIPGEPIEILLGMMYGTVGGLLLSLLGIALGQTIVFMLVKRFGISFARRFANVDKFSELGFLKEPSGRDGLIFLLFFIPGTPKDILTYFAPFTGIGYLRFILLSTLARIPSVVSSTWAGSTITDGNLIKSVIIFAVTGIAGCAGILINNRITKRKNQKDSNSL